MSAMHSSCSCHICKQRQISQRSSLVIMLRMVFLPSELGSYLQGCVPAQQVRAGQPVSPATAAAGAPCALHTASSHPAASAQSTAEIKAGVGRLRLTVRF